MKHIYDWINEPPKNETEKLVKEWFDKFCVPAMDCDYDFLSSKILSCSYKNKRYYCVGASHLGDVWLSNKLPKEMPCGYNYRVDIEECSDWKIKNKKI